MQESRTCPMICLEGVRKWFGRKTPLRDERKVVIDGVDLAVRKGEIVCLLGPSGCGKTTIVNLVMGNLVPNEGEVRVMGELAPYKHARQRIGFMPQDEGLYNDITASDNLRFFGSMYGMRASDIARRSKEALEFGRLEEDAKKLVSAYSGGMKRRLSLGVALMHEPELLVLDEPTVGLDPDHRRRIWNEFERLVADGRTLLVTTHVMDEAERCSRIVMLFGGRIIADGSPSAILEEASAGNLEDAFIAFEEGVMVR